MKNYASVKNLLPMYFHTAGGLSSRQVHRSGIARGKCKHIFNSVRYCQISFQRVASICIPTSYVLKCIWMPISPQPPRQTVLWCFSFFVSLIGEKWYLSQSCFNLPSANFQCPCTFPPICLRAIFYIFFDECVSCPSPHFTIGLVGFVPQFLRVTYVLGRSTLFLWHNVVNIFF